MPDEVAVGHYRQRCEMAVGIDLVVEKLEHGRSPFTVTSLAWRVGSAYSPGALTPTRPFRSSPPGQAGG